MALGEEYLPNVAQGVSAAVELADELDSTYGFLIEKTLAAGAFPGGLDKSDHDVVLQHLPGDTCLFSRRTYAHQCAFLGSSVQGSSPLITQAPSLKPQASSLPQLSHQASKRRI